jgi:uncharacterized protein
MKCPKCNEVLLMTDKNGVEIDYCPTCRGIWLDRGELEKIMERAGNHYAKRDNYDNDYKKYDYGDYHDKDRYSSHPPQHQYPPKKKKSFFDDFFDFD